MNLKSYFKVLFIIGIFISFLSLFFDWYSFQAQSLDGELVVFWNFHLFLGWNTIFSPDAWFNEAFRPRGEQLPPIIPIIYILIMIAAMYTILFIDLEHPNKFEKAKIYSYIHLFLLLFGGFFICVIPIYYWLSQELFFPYIIFEDFELEVIFEYTVGLGYLLQSLGFTVIFPYSLYYYYTTTHFEKKDVTLESALQNIISQVQESLDFDKLIAEERLKMPKISEGIEAIKQQEIQSNQIYKKFLKSRGIK